MLGTWVNLTGGIAGILVLCLVFVIIVKLTLIWFRKTFGIKKIYEEPRDIHYYNNREL